MFKKIITIKKAICLIIALSCVGGVITIVQAEVLNFNKAKKELTKIYKSLDDPRSFYCNCPIVSQGKKLVPDIAACGYTPYKQAKRATRIEYEHIMPASWLGRQLQCWQNGGRKGCKNNRAFNIREGDMHNLVPAIGEINAYRSNYRFNLIPSKSKSKFGQCQFFVSDTKPRAVEPAEYTRGFIGRASLYMSDRYDIHMSKQQKELMQIWAKKYPATEFECWRNKKISSIQGNENPYISESCNTQGIK